MKSIQGHLRQHLQWVPTSNVLHLPLYIGALLNNLSKKQINQVQDVSHKVTLLLPNSLTQEMDGLFKYYNNRTGFVRALS